MHKAKSGGEENLEMRPSAMRPGSPRYRALSRGSRSRAPRVPKLELPAPLSSGESGPAGWTVVSAVCRMRCPLRAVDGGEVYSMTILRCVPWNLRVS